MSEQSINIADLIRPKFKPGQTVFRVYREYNRRISEIRPVHIVKVCALVQITSDKGVEQRTMSMHYVNHSGHEFAESELVANLNDLDEQDRAPRVS